MEDAEIRRLQADLARLSSEVAAGGAALHPAPARAAAAADAAAVAEFLFQQAWKKAYGKKSQYNLGKMFAKGRGVAQDDAEAVRWYRLAAAQGHAGATAALARFGA